MKAITPAIFFAVLFSFSTQSDMTANEVYLTQGQLGAMMPATTSQYYWSSTRAPGQGYNYQISQDDIQKALKIGSTQMTTGVDQVNLLNAQVENLKNLLLKRGYNYSFTTGKADSAAGDVTISLQKCEKNFKDSQDANSSLTAQLKALGDKVADQVSKSEQTILSLQAQISDLQKKHAETESALKQEQEKTKNQTEHIQTLTTQLNGFQQQTEECKKQAAQASAESAQKLAGFQNELAKANSTLKSCQDETQKLTVEIKDAKSQGESLSAQLAAKTMSATVADQFAQLQNELKSIKALSEKCQQDLVAANQSNSAQNQQLQELTTRSASLKQSGDQSKAQLADLQAKYTAQIEELKNSCNKQMADLKSQNEFQVANARKSIQAECDSKVQGLTGQLNNAQSQMSELNANMARIQTTLQQQVQGCQNQVSSLNSQKLLLEQQITTQTQSCDKVVEQRNRYGQILLNLQNRLRAFQKNVLSVIQGGDNANNQQIRTVLQ